MFASKNFDLTIYPDPKNENHFLRKLISKSNFENRLNIVSGFWVLRGNHFEISLGWIEHFFGYIFYERYIYL